MTIPADIEKRKVLNGYIDEQVGNLKKIDKIKKDIAYVRKTVKETFKYDSPDIDFNNLVQARYDESVLLDQIAEKEDAIANNNILLGKMVEDYADADSVEEEEAGNPVINDQGSLFE